MPRSIGYRGRAASLLLLSGCVRPQSDGYRRDVDADLHLEQVEILGFTRTIPPCAEDQMALSVEAALQAEYTPGDCLLIEGQLVLDAAPRACATQLNPSVVCPAQWMLLGERGPEPKIALPGVSRNEADPHTLFLQNDYHSDRPKRDCEDDDAGDARLPRGVWRRLPSVHRDRSRAPRERGLPSLHVVILGDVRDPCRINPSDVRGQSDCEKIYSSSVKLTTPGQWFDIERICSLVGTPGPGGPSLH